MKEYILNSSPWHKTHTHTHIAWPACNFSQFRLHCSIWNGTSVCAMRPYSAFIHAYILFPDIFACIFSFSTYLSIIKVTNKHCAGGVRPSSPLDFVGVVRVNNMLSAVWVSIVSVLQFISAQHFVEDGSIFILFFCVCRFAVAEQRT